MKSKRTIGWAGESLFLSRIISELSTCRRLHPIRGFSDGVVGQFQYRSSFEWSWWIKQRYSAQWSLTLLYLSQSFRFITLAIATQYVTRSSRWKRLSSDDVSSGDFLLKSSQTHSVPVIVSSTRGVNIVPSSAGYRTPPTNGRPLETIRHSDSGDPVTITERQFSSGLNEKPLRNPANLYDTKYDNCAVSSNRLKYDTVTLILQRDKRVLDFGFSISDRLYGTGVYVNKIRPHGPAELEGTLMPCMRIYRVRANRDDWSSDELSNPLCLG